VGHVAVVTDSVIAAVDHTAVAVQIAAADGAAVAVQLVAVDSTAVAMQSSAAAKDTTEVAANRSLAVVEAVAVAAHYIVQVVHCTAAVEDSAPGTDVAVTVELNTVLVWQRTAFVVQEVVVVAEPIVEMNQDTVAVAGMAVAKADTASRATHMTAVVHVVEFVELSCSRKDSEVAHWDTGTDVEDRNVFADTSAICQ